MESCPAAKTQTGTSRNITSFRLGVLKKLGIKQKKGPALQMDRSDHEDTRSFGKGRDAREFRHEILDMLEGGDISGAIKASLQDLEQFGDKYKSGANQALKKLFPWLWGS